MAGNSISFIFRVIENLHFIRSVPTLFNPPFLAFLDEKTGEMWFPFPFRTLKETELVGTRPQNFRG